MSKRIRTLFFCFSIFLSATIMANPAKTPLSTIAPPVRTPTQAIKDLDKQGEQYRVGKNLTEADQAFNKQLKEKILRGTFDLRELSKLALDKYWNQRSPREQDQFVELLTNLLEERSVLSKEKAQEKSQDQPYYVLYRGEVYSNKEKTDSLVKTVVHLKKHNMKVELHYKLKKIPTGWRIYDVIMDNASLVENYRYSFGNIISKQGYPELVRRMQNKLNEFRAKRS